MVDTFLLLLAPAGGDELQGIKRGVMELADIVTVNKADGDLADAARHAAADYRHALRLIRPRWPSWEAEVLLCSAATGDGLDEVWDAVGRHRAALEASGDLERLRQGQRVEWLWSDVQDRLLSAARGLPSADDLTAAVTAGDVEPGAAAQSLVNELLNGNH
jgi:LAO/AO transport system kinase